MVHSPHAEDCHAYGRAEIERELLSEEIAVDPCEDSSRPTSKAGPVAHAIVDIAGEDGRRLDGAVADTRILVRPVKWDCRCECGTQKKC